jgi:hypothetical protein
LSAWRGQREVIDECHRRINAKSQRRLQLERYAATLAEAGDRTLRPTTPLRSGTGETVAALLYAKSIRASLSAIDSGVVDLAENEALRGLVNRALPPGVPVERLFDLLRDSSDAEMEEQLDATATEAEGLAGVARALLDLTRAPERELQRAHVRRMMRAIIPLVILAFGVGGAAWIGVHFARGPDLAEGKPWKASSTYRGFSPEAGICDGRKTSIFFHTNRENNPWVELDLAAPTTIGRVDIRNRHDCCRDRAFPLAVEVSVDGQTWRELGRIEDPFTEWTLEFQPTKARYVRAKAMKRTFLHLESFEIR